LAWTTDSVTIGAMVATILALILIVFILVFWYTKSKQRQMERLERRNSVRASIRSSRSFASSGSLNESEYRRRLAEFVRKIGVDMKKYRYIYLDPGMKLPYFFLFFVITAKVHEQKSPAEFKQLQQSEREF